MRTAAVTQCGGDTMGTSWSVRIAGSLHEEAIAAVHAVLALVIDQMSNWETTSAISILNRTPPGTWLTMPAAFLHVLRAGLDVASRSGGAFDPTIGESVDAWGFGPSGLRVTPPDHIPPASPGWRAIEVQGERVRRTAAVALDFSGIAKGYAVDAVTEALAARGIRHALVEIGGELRGMGVRPDGQPWWVDVETPPGLSLPVTRVALCGLSIATSGDYRRWFAAGGKRFSHSIDPRTGAPITNNVASVSVLHASAMLADAWATAIAVLGPREGLLLAARERLAVLMVTREGENGAREWMSPALADMLDAPVSSDLD